MADKIIRNSKLDTLLSKLATVLASKFWRKAETTQVSVDSAPTSASTNLVTSGGVYTAIDAKYTKPANGIPASDIESGVIPTVPVQDVTLGGTSVLSGGTAVLPAYPTVPTISTSVATDAASDVKTASPKAVADYAVQSLTTGGKKIWCGTQAEYDLLTPDANTLYFITEASS